MPFSELPTDVVCLLFEECVLQWGLWHAVRHRLVDRFFDREIRHAICSTRYLESYHSGAGDLVNWQLKQQYLEYVIRIGNPGNISLARAIHDSVRALDLENKGPSSDESVWRMKHLCKEGVERRPQRPEYWLSNGRVIEDTDPDHTSRTEGNTLLTAAIICGEISAHPDLLENPQHLSTCNVFFGTPLACAAAAGSQEAVDILLDKGVRDSYSLRTEPAAIEVAAARGHNNIIQSLLNADANKSVYHRQPRAFYRLLDNAVEGRQLSTIKLLLASDLAAKNKEKIQQIVFSAATQGDEAIVRYLITHTAVKEEKPYCWRAPAYTRSPNITELLMDNFIFTSTNINDAACRAASKGRLSAFRYLHRRGSFINFRRALRSASCSGRDEIVRYILTELKPPTKDVWIPLGLAAERGFDSVFQILYQYVSQAEDWQSTGEALRMSLTSARRYRHLNIVHTLIGFSSTVIKHVDPDLGKEITGLVENRTDVGCPDRDLVYDSPLSHIS